MVLNYRSVISELEPEAEFGDYNSYYLTWYENSYSGDDPYWEPLSCSQAGPYSDYNSLIHEEADDEMELFYGGGGNMLGCCESYFGGCSGEDDAYTDKGYEAYGSSLDKEDNQYQGEEKFGSNYTTNDDMQLSYGDDQWSSYGGFSFGLCGMEDFHDHDYQELPYNNSFDCLNEIIPYGTIFGYEASLLRYLPGKPH